MAIVASQMVIVANQMAIVSNHMAIVANDWQSIPYSILPIFIQIVFFSKSMLKMLL